MPSLLPKSQYLRKKYYNLQEFEIIGNRINKNLTYEFLAIVKEENVDSFTETSIIKFNSNNVSLDVKISPEEQTVWLNQNQIAILYDTTQQNVSLHINNIFQDNELDKNSVHKEYLYIGINGKEYPTSFYNLDMILAIGYRTKTTKAIEFRKWATSVLKEYLLKGYVINRERALVTEDNFLNLCNRVGKLENEVHKIMEDNKHLLIEDKVIFEGQLFEGALIINQILGTAIKAIVLIDPYVDIGTLSYFKAKSSEASLHIITSSKSKIAKEDIVKFSDEYGKTTIEYDERYHDRHLIIDNSVFYHLGASINYLGKRFSQITKVIDEDIIKTLQNRIKKINS